METHFCASPQQTMDKEISAVFYFSVAHGSLQFKVT